MRGPSRDPLVLSGAAALAVAVPIMFVWPVHQEVRGSVPPILTVVPPITVALTGAAVGRHLFGSDVDPMPEAGPGSNPGGEVQPAPPPAPTLVGLITKGRSGVALARLSSGETVTLRVGEEAQGWRLVHIAADHATFRSSDQQVDVPLDLRNKSGAANNAAIPAPPPPGVPIPMQFSDPTRP